MILNQIFVAESKLPSSSSAPAVLFLTQLSVTIKWLYKEYMENHVSPGISGFSYCSHPN